MDYSMYLKYFIDDFGFPFFIQYGEHDTDLLSHYHNDFSELVIVLNGTATHIVNNEEYFIKKGDVFVINSGTAHGYKNTSDFKICNIMYRLEELFPFESDIKKISGFHALFVIEPYLAKEHNFQSRLKLQLFDFEPIKILLDKMVHEYTSQSTGYQTILKAYFLQLIVNLSRTYNISNYIDKDNRINIAKPVSYIESNYTQQISIDELASQANISPRHFARIFKYTYKTTPMNYIILLRVQHARFLLKNTSISISDIAFECGFNDSNYFTRQFKKIFNVTPKQFRQQSLNLKNPT